jgi:multimeric flavodoxin WrbA
MISLTGYDVVLNNTINNRIIGFWIYQVIENFCSREGSMSTSSKRIIMVLGSPRKQGNSEILAHRVADGAKNAAKATVKCFYLNKMDIKPCTACDICREDIDLNCIIKDDMQDVYPKLRQMDALVIASPIYYCMVTGPTKLFMDRWYALGGPQGNALKGKRIGIVLTYDNIDPFRSGAINAIRMFQDTFNYLGSNIVGVVYGRALAVGEIKSNRDVLEKAYLLGKQLVD